ncbi:MAG: hypothetical protein ACRBN8_23735 [Nannocystales bacterium]
MHCRSLLASIVILALPACTSDAEEDTDSGTDTEMGSTSDSTTSDLPTTASTSSSSSGDTGSESTSSSSGSAETSTTGGADESSTGTTEENICYGYSFLGFTHQVYTDGTAVGDPVCTTEPAPCEGDVVGTWTAEDSCGYEALPNFFDEICPGATQQITGSMLSGTRTFNEDGTYEIDQTTQLQADLQVDSVACAGLECEEFGTALSKGPEFDMTCADAAGGGCDCTYTVLSPDAQTGTWDLFGGGLLLTSEAGESQGVFDYCVDAGRFSMWTPLYEETPFPDVTCTENDDCEGQVEGTFDAVGCEEPEEDDR